MATYNGQKHLKQQLDSIFAQSNQDWRLLVRDDGSTDDTVSIIENYCTKYPDRIQLIADGDGRLGVHLNFSRLLQQAAAEYTMLSDQDDVWLPNKIEMTLNRMRSAEQIYTDIPILVHTDLKVVDSGLNTIADSIWKYQKLFPEIGDDFKMVAAQNVVTSCTAMLNRKAIEFSTPVPAEAVIHDWWLAIKVAMHGKIVYVSIPSVLYRQHSGCQIGAKEAKRINICNFLKKLCRIRKLLSAQYKMVKKADSNMHLSSLILNKTRIKIAQRLR